MHCCEKTKSIFCEHLPNKGEKYFCKGLGDVFVEHISIKGNNTYLVLDVINGTDDMMFLFKVRRSK